MPGDVSRAGMANRRNEGCLRGRGAMCSEGEARRRSEGQARRRNEGCLRGRGAMLNVRAREVLCIARAYQIIDVGCPVF